MRNWLQGLALSAAALLVALLALEGGLRFLPVCEGLNARPVNAADPVLRFEPNRSLIWSRFADFSMQNRVHVNNAGFVNDQDYVPAAFGQSPLVAVVGDSYVEALMVPYARTLQGRLAEELRGRARVYSFAASGSALTQYLAYAAHARERYRPARGIVVVIGNDFDESLLEYKAAPGLHAFRQGPDNSAELVRVDYTPSLAVRLLRHSRLALYLVNNLEAAALPGKLAALFHPQTQAAYVGQTEASADERKMALSRWAADAFLDQLPAAFGLPAGDILLIVDAPRPELYDPAASLAAQSSYFGRMRAYLMERARLLGFRVADMAALFAADYAKNGRRFEFPRDAHWNAEGHRVAAEAVLASGLLKGL